MEEVSSREAYGRTLVELGRENPNLVVLDADLSKSTLTRLFAQEFPRRFFDCGLAEQNMMSIASGLAASGKTVFASTFAVFATGRCFDQLRMSIAQPHRNVKIVATHGGITVGEDGFSHHAIEDLALVSSLPGFVVIVPVDARETAQAVKVAAATPGPFYIRLSRQKTPLVHSADYSFTLGKAALLRRGKDATILSLGIMARPAMVAAERLASQRIDCRLLSISTLKPMDTQAVLQAARETGALVTVEEHLEHGGLGSAVCRIVAQSAPVPVSVVAIKDTYTKSGKPEELLRLCGLTAEDIEKAVLSVLARKRGPLG